MPGGVSRTVFIAGIVIAVCASVILSACSARVLIQRTTFQGLKGDKGDKGEPGPEGPIGTFTIGDISGHLPPPEWDSGWMPTINGSQTYHHGLATTDLLVYILGTYTFNATHIVITPYTQYNMPVYWLSLTPDDIVIANSNTQWTLIRIMIWHIATPTPLPPVLP